MVCIFRAGDTSNLSLHFNLLLVGIFFSGGVMDFPCHTRSPAKKQNMGSLHEDRPGYSHTYLAMANEGLIPWLEGFLSCG